MLEIPFNTMFGRGEGSWESDPAVQMDGQQGIFQERKQRVKGESGRQIGVAHATKKRQIKSESDSE
jgi:hypothetical protein